MPVTEAGGGGLVGAPITAGREPPGMLDPGKDGSVVIAGLLPDGRLADVGPMAGGRM